jgi:hypothetical protein
VIACAQGCTELQLSAAASAGKSKRRAWLAWRLPVEVLLWQDDDYAETKLL